MAHPNDNRVAQLYGDINNNLAFCLCSQNAHICMHRKCMWKTICGSLARTGSSPNCYQAMHISTGCCEVCDNCSFKAVTLLLGVGMRIVFMKELWWNKELKTNTNISSLYIIYLFYFIPHPNIFVEKCIPPVVLMKNWCLR